MNVFVFGGSGFVGRHLVTALKENGFSAIVCDILATGKEDIKVDVKNIEQLNNIPFKEEDVVVNLAANQYHTKVPKKNRREYFFDTNATGVKNILAAMNLKGCRNLIQFTTDMTYGKPIYLPVDTSHPQNPFGYYGQSKKAAEGICKEYRNKGMNITIFRPRMIVGPERLGVLVKLFKLIDLGLPVPMIGNGRNHYQMISVFDCVSAIIAAINYGVPNQEYNLGSKNPPCIKELLKNVVKTAGSRSIVVPTWAPLVKSALSFFRMIGIEIMYKEQYMIANEEYILDISKTENELKWKPLYNDSDMINESYKYYSQI